VSEAVREMKNCMGLTSPVNAELSANVLYKWKKNPWLGSFLDYYRDQNGIPDIILICKKSA